MKSTLPMKSRSAPLLLLLLLPAMVAAVAVAARKGPLVGGWTPITDVKDPHVQEIGKFAVAAYNTQSKGAIKFDRVESGETQVVSGTNYRLVVVAKDGGGSTAKYQAIVWEKPWENFKKLTSFKPVAN
ncbi:cysteine proteinase inhibitor 5-like [Momordica charantia]|uniref:Cysteine proteinase inhibitor 5-like n=1 Tax=Momordica charantia TaxID=3673 RepID=A0A6J1CMN4_MOMCH|nr:cysteine proteinase inhibitor 5-like [Momordica charantia]